MSAREVRPIDWSKYPIRTCQSLHCCDVCGESITLGQQYRDGGYGRRAHVSCLSGDDPSRCIEIGIPGGGMMGRVPSVPPATVAEWITHTRETGILEFEKLQAIADKLQADLARKDQAIMAAHEALFWHDRSTITVGGGDPDDAGNEDGRLKAKTSARHLRVHMKEEIDK